MHFFSFGLWNIEKDFRYLFLNLTLHWHVLSLLFFVCLSAFFVCVCVCVIFSFHAYRKINLNCSLSCRLPSHVLLGRLPVICSCVWFCAELFVVFSYPYCDKVRVLLKFLHHLISLSVKGLRIVYFVKIYRFCFL